MWNNLRGSLVPRPCVGSCDGSRQTSLRRSEKSAPRIERRVARSRRICEEAVDFLRVRKRAVSAKIDIQCLNIQVLDVTLVEIDL